MDAAIQVEILKSNLVLDERQIIEFVKLSYLISDCLDTDRMRLDIFFNLLVFSQNTVFDLDFDCGI